MRIERAEASYDPRLYFVDKPQEAQGLTQKAKPELKPESVAASKPPVNPMATDAQLRDEGFGDSEIKQMKRLGQVQCETCANRTYQDASGDPGVSFKSPTKLSPGMAATAVASHEREHVNRNAAKAAQEDKVAYSTVRLFSAVCPECGKSYISGGETMTMTKSKAKTQDFANKFMEAAVVKGVGTNVDKDVE
ncbi:MAG: hypothetical protein LBS19_09015 [Clostridiales bacterium]|jgi:hypothetical protein|nr:hypothetical protein [Clostridiales bacterium]